MDPTVILKELLDELAWRSQSESLYYAFTEALETIPDADTKSDCCLNILKYQATQNASARAKNKLDEVELGNLFEDECRRFAGDLMKMPGQFREWLASPAGQAERERQAKVAAPTSIVDILVDIANARATCPCPRCRSFREDVQRSEAPTEAPPPPDVTH